METLARIRALLRNLFRRRQGEAELDAELRAYVEQLTDEKVAAGMSAEDARRAARIELGGAEQVKEEVRAARAGVLLDTLWQDLRYAVRMLRKNPGFATVVVVTLGLGIGVNTAIFGVVNAFMLKPLPVVRDPSELVWLRGSSSYATFNAYRDQSREVLSDLAALGGTTSFNLSAGGRSELVKGELVTAGYFAVLGVDLAVGREFLAQEDAPGAPPVAVVSHALWQNRFAGDPGVVGKTVLVNGLAVLVVGVAPRGFIGAEVGLPRDLWLPMALQPRIGPSAAEGESGKDMLHDSNIIWLNVIGRLRPGVSLDRAQAALAAIAARIADDAGDPRKAELVRAASLLPVVGGLDPRDRLDAVVVAALLMAVVGLVLLVACSNVAGLLLARASSRAKDVGIRRALGAGRLRVVRQLLTESLILALLGGAAGLLLAWWTGSLLARLGSAAPIAPPDLGIDYRVLGFAAAISLLTTFVFGLAPAIQASGADVVAALKLDTGALGVGYRRSRLRNGLVIAQVALSLLLLIGAGLFVRSLQNARNVDPGFKVERGLLLTVHPATLGLGEDQRRALYGQILDGVAVVPGVERATFMALTPLGLSSAMGEVTPEETDGSRPTSPVLVGLNAVGPGYLETMGIPLVRGRDINRHDRPGAPATAVISQSLARRLYPDADPLGRRIRFRDDAWLEIVGVAADSKVVSLGDGRRELLYLPLLQGDRPTATLLVRTAIDPAAAVASIQEALQAIAPNLPVSDVKTLSDQVDLALLPARLGAALLGAFGLLALVLASVGVYGLVAYSVKQRTHEIGVRLALGARRGDILKLILREGTVVVAIGVAIGIGLALAVTRLFASFLYGIEPSDPTTFAGISLLLLGIATIAGYLPARRALGVDPLVSLRHE